MIFQAQTAASVMGVASVTDSHWMCGRLRRPSVAVAVFKLDQCVIYCRKLLEIMKFLVEKSGNIMDMFCIPVRFRVQGRDGSARI